MARSTSPTPHTERRRSDAGAWPRSVFQSSPEETAGAAESAITQGYRLIDTAAAYFNERQVGEGLWRSQSAVTTCSSRRRSGSAITGTTPRCTRSTRARQAWRRPHRPAAPASAAGEPLRSHARGLPRAREIARRRKGARHGVSNFMPDHLRRLLAETSVVPAVNRIEVHPYFQQTALQRLHAEHGILTQAWSPIGGITSYFGGDNSAFDDPTLHEIACQHGRSSAQVMLRRHLQAKGAPPSRSRRRLPGSPKTSMFVTSNFRGTRSPRSTRWTRGCAAAPTRTASPSKRTAFRSRRCNGRG